MIGAVTQIIKLVYIQPLLCTRYYFKHLIFIFLTIIGSKYYYLYFTDEETES